MSKRRTVFDLNAIRNSAVAHLNQHLFQNEKKAKSKQVPKKTPTGLLEIKRTLTINGIKYEEEYKFHPERKFRFDLAIIDEKIAIEYEGIFSQKSRHTSVKGYSTDADKYNLAQQLGWKVLRYTAMNFKNFDKDIKELIN